MPQKERPLAAIVFTDNSALAQRDESPALDLLEEQRELLLDVAHISWTKVDPLLDSSQGDRPLEPLVQKLLAPKIAQ